MSVTRVTASLLACVVGACRPSVLWLEDGDPDLADEASPSESDTSSDAAAPSDTPDGGGTTVCPLPLPEDWIMCEDFETGHALEEVCSNVDTVSGDMRIVAGEGVSGGHALESAYAVGRVENGWCHIGFGRSPLASSLRSAEDFAEIYWRVRVRMDTSFIPQGGIKLTRTMSFSGADWSQAWVAGLWSTTSGEGALIADPASCVATVSASAVDCVGYNDLAHLRWLGPFGVGSNNLFASAQAGVWHCVEGHLRLNTPGVADGVFEYWTDGQLRGSRTDLSFRGSWTGYGINDILLDGYWDGGSPTPTKRWLDDVVIAESRIGCD